MLSGIDPSAERFLYDLNRLKVRGERAQQQISSGYRLNRASDDPGAVPEVVEAETGLTHFKQVQQNLGRISAETDGAERSLQSAVVLLDRISVLASQGATSTLGADKRKVLAGEVGAAFERLVAIANTAVGGRYVFSGDADQTQPYTVDFTLADGVSIYAGMAATREAEDSNGGRFAVSLTAEEIFQNNAEINVFGAVNGLKTALEANDQEGVEASLTALASAREHLNGKLASYGTVQNRIDGELDAVSSRMLECQTTIARLRETDLVAASLELVQAQTGQQAALSARSRLPRSSLFDYLG